MNDQLTRMMARIQLLLNQADHPGTGAEEAATFRDKAEELMRKYRIEEEQLIATDAGVIEVQHHTLFLYDWSNPFGDWYRRIIWTIADHAGVRVVTRYAYGNEPDGYYGDVFGYEGDIRLLEWLWSSARLVFGSHLEPTLDSSLSDQVNAYNLRQSGMLRREVARIVFGANTPKLRSLVQRLYVAECKARGESPGLSGLGTDSKAYRIAYADSFVARLYDKLRVARDAVDSVGGALVLAGRAERIAEAMYKVHPRLRPRPAGSEVTEPDATPAKKVKEKKWTKADQREWDRRHGPSTQAGHSAGGSAASKVQVDRTFTSAQRLES